MLSIRQQAILRFLLAYIREYGYPPSTDDIRYSCNISSKSVVRYNIGRLVKLGFITEDTGEHRTIAVVNRPGHTVTVPVIGELGPNGFRAYPRYLR